RRRAVIRFLCNSFEFLARSLRRRARMGRGALAPQRSAPAFFFPPPSFKPLRHSVLSHVPVSRTETALARVERYLLLLALWVRAQKERAAGEDTLPLRCGKTD